jgi:hypothetical protein
MDICDVDQRGVSIKEATFKFNISPRNLALITHDAGEYDAQASIELSPA